MIMSLATLISSFGKLPPNRHGVTPCSWSKKDVADFHKRLQGG